MAEPGGRVRARDLGVAIAAALAVAVAVLLANRAVPASTYTGTTDVWFEADLRRVFWNMTDRFGDHYRAKVHPLFSLVAYTLTYLPRILLRRDPVTAVRIVIVGVAFVWALVFFALVRRIAGTLAALLLTLLAGVSASMLFIGSVPETYLLGSLSMLAALLTVTLVPRLGRRGELAVTAASALTLSFTLTNWMAGIAAAIVSLPWRRAVQATLNAFAVVVLLWGFQRYFFHNAQFFLGDKEERDYMYRPTPQRAAEVLNGFAVTPIVMPRFVPEFRDYQNEAVMFTQRAKPGSSGAVGVVAIVLWLALLALALAGMRGARELRALQVALLLTIGGQLALHTVYGEETFLYSPHFAPLLLVASAFAFRTRARAAAIAIVILLTIAAGVNNVRELERACAFAANPPVKAGAPHG